MESSPPICPDLQQPYESNLQGSLLAAKFQEINPLQIDYFLAQNNLVLSKINKRAFELSNIGRLTQTSPQKIGMNDFFGESISVGNQFQIFSQNSVISEQNCLLKCQNRLPLMQQIDFQEQSNNLRIMSKKALKMFTIAYQLKSKLFGKFQAVSHPKKSVETKNFDHNFFNTIIQPSKQKKFSQKLQMEKVKLYEMNPTQKNLEEILLNLHVCKKTFMGWVKKYKLLGKRDKLIKQLYKLYKHKNSIDFQGIFNEQPKIKVEIDSSNIKVSKKQFKDLARQVYESKNFAAIERWCSFFIKRNNLQQICECEQEGQKHE